MQPANDSAASNAERLRQLDVRHATTVQVVRDVRARLISEARSRLQGGRAADAGALLDAAESLGGDADLGELRASIASAQQAVATAAAAPKLPPLKMTRPPRPKYPASAKGVEGWVRVEFYVTPEGRTERVRVLSSEPAGVFDAAGRIRQWEAPGLRNSVDRLATCGSTHRVQAGVMEGISVRRTLEKWPTNFRHACRALAPCGWRWASWPWRSWWACLRPPGTSPDASWKTTPRFAPSVSCSSSPRACRRRSTRSRIVCAHADSFAIPSSS